jgi:hypothetical protein
MPVSGVGANSRGAWQWLYGDPGDPDYVTMTYGTVYHAMGLHVRRDRARDDDKRRRLLDVLRRAALNDIDRPARAIRAPLFTSLAPIEDGDLPHTLFTLAAWDYGLGRDGLQQIALEGRLTDSVAADVGAHPVTSRCESGESAGDGLKPSTLVKSP